MVRLTLFVVLGLFGYRFGQLVELSKLHAADPQSKSQQDRQKRFEEEVLPILRDACFDCHGPQEANEGIALHKYPDVESVTDDRKVWERILRALRFGKMPPQGGPALTQEKRKLLVDWIRPVITEIDCDLPRLLTPVTIRRLNRNEYDNTIRDLLGLDIQPARNFPSDDVGEGFDNIGDVLSLPPLLFEKYLDAAEAIAAAAIVIIDPDSVPRQRREKKRLKSDGATMLNRAGIYSMWSTARVEGTFEFPREGEFELRVVAGADQAGPEVAKLELALDGKPIGVVDVKSSRRQPAPVGLTAIVKSGSHRFSARFINDYYRPDDPDPKNRDRNVYVVMLEVAGPLNVADEAIPAVQKQLVKAKPGSVAEAVALAQESLRPLIRRAFRRPVTDDEVASLAAFVQLAMQRGESYERGLQVALSAMLVSPHFLFRVEPNDSGDPQEPEPRLTDAQLACRLSYFLWSSMPDADLFALADANKLNSPEELDLQVRRMLQDPKAQALAENFAGQWLNLRNLDAITPDPQQFKSFSDELRSDMKRETLAFFNAVVSEDRSLLDFLNADFSFVNERLARHYGIDGVTGDAFRRISLEGVNRAGILTHASILTLTSNPTRTSPVKRGKWIMENVLGTPPPDPPADIPDLAVTQKVAPDLPLRKQLEIHRQDASCAVCHREMDTLGLGFENFDAIGRWRIKSGDQLIDPSGVLPDGKKFNSPLELVAILRARGKGFVRAFAEKMLIYALGRGLTFYDRCAIDKIVNRVVEQDYRFSVLVTEIVKSEPFRMVLADGGHDAN
ncbi:MAG: DUF1592 domain-containing protein [Planctomycetota bacterium]|nr:DUF1592 domain-containing protein [Planctomycetota bacterium]